ncbi:hypothetical protein B9Z49_15300 [Limnohabitans sp. 2KL-51]|nr:hypothetical protein B9Z49_15300 [Limnohabitans sp. 2KL-51]
MYYKVMPAVFNFLNWSIFVFLKLWVELVALKELLTSLTNHESCLNSRIKFCHNAVSHTLLRSA